MNNSPNYERNISLPAAYDFLRNKGLTSEVDNIQYSRDTYKSYTGTLKRAKIIKVLTDKGCLDEFIEKVWPSGKTPKGETRLRFLQGLYERATGSYVGNEEESEEDAVETLEESQFAYESDLRDYLAKNLRLIEPGLTLYEGNNGVSGIEIAVDDSGRRIDILAIDSSGIPVVIELKVRRGHERTIGQALYYRAKVKERLSSPLPRVVIIAREISEELRLATEDVSGIELFEYKLSMNLHRKSGLQNNATNER